MGGKRWRPVIMLLTYEALGREPEEILLITSARTPTYEELISRSIVVPAEDTTDIEGQKP
ncbi:MAG: hypothetical protein QXR41_07845 [Nitrososphaerota archaeon]